MKDKIFIDSNILIYAYSIDELSKKSTVEDLLNAHETVIISTQTINEFINVMTKKKKLDYKQIALVVRELFSVFLVQSVDSEIIQKAIDIALKHHYSYFDSLIISAAIASDCSILYSEDMHHNHIIEDRLKIVNPFK